MIDTYAEKTALALKRINPEQTASVEVMKYGLIMLFNGLTVAGLTLLGGWLGGRFIETLYTLAAVAVLRFLSGGFHFNSAYLCIGVSTAMMIAIPYIPIGDHMNMVLTGISLILMLIYAPSNVEDQTRIPEKYYLPMKLVSMAIVSANFFFLSPVMCVVLFTQSITLVKFKEVWK